MCYYPLKGFVLGYKPNGKYNLKVCSSDIEFVYTTETGSYAFDCNYPTQNPENYNKVYNYIDIPCGKCSACRLEYSRTWAVRCMLESTLHEHNYFLTLTYSNKCPKENPTKKDLQYHDSIINDITRYPMVDGKPVRMLSLCKKHLQDFFKRLRVNLERDYGLPSFRYYSCGEYGSQNLRPHYHVIAFGLNLPDLVPYKESKLGHQYYTSALLDKSWKHGLAIIGECTFESCAYVARYCMKKLNGDAAEYYTKYDVVPEFSLMSRSPGIAADYYHSNFSDIYKYDCVVLPDGKTCSPPRYFDKLFESDHSILHCNVNSLRYAVDQISDLKNSDVNNLINSGHYTVEDDNDFLNEYDLLPLDSIKDIRRYNASQTKLNILSSTDVSEDEYNKVCEINSSARIKKLVRPL